MSFGWMFEDVRDILVAKLLQPRASTLLDHRTSVEVHLLVYRQ